MSAKKVLSYFTENSESRGSRFWFFIFFILINLGFLGLQTPWFVVRWDAYDYWLPRLHWMGNALRAGYFPDYLPYIFSGYSLGGDIQAGVYNPIYLLISFLFANSVYSATVLFFFFLCTIYLFCFRISCSLFKEKLTAFYFSISVVICGAVLPHASHFSFLASYVGFLGLFAALLDLVEHKVRRGALIAFVSTWFVLTSGYATLLISQAVVLLFIALYLSLFILKPHYKEQFRFWIWGLFGVSGGIFCSLPALIHFSALLALTDRAHGQSLETLAAGSMPWKSFLGFLVPIMTIKTPVLDLTLAQMNVLISTPVFIIYRIFQKSSKWGGRDYLLACTLILFLILGMGSYFPIPLRMWLAELCPLFRVGRFPAVEFQIYSLIILIYFSAVGLETLLQKITLQARRKILIFLLIDILLVLSFKRRFVIQKIDTLDLSSMKVDYTRHDDNNLNQKRDCPPDLKTIRNNDIGKAPWFSESHFSAQGFSPMAIESYVQDFAQINWAICEPGRLFSVNSRVRIPYTLVYYNPAGMKFLFKPLPEEQDYLWSETLDSFWQLKINGQEAVFMGGPGHLRYFRILPNSQEEISIEMIYRGPLSRFFRY